MQISIFGPLRVASAHDELTQQDFEGVKPRELLALLLLARGRPITKETLAEQLWPDRQPKNVGGTLETYVSLLRRKLFFDRTIARRVLSTSAGAYAFDTSQVALDIDLFDDLVARADIAGNDRMGLLSQATELVRGDLLCDLGDPPWLVAERELYRDRATRAHLLLGEDLLTSRAFGSSIAHAEAALRVRPYSEEAFRIIMLANHAMGHTENSRLAFVRCRALLAEHLGHDPTTETEDLAAAISAGAPGDELLAERTAGHAVSTPGSAASGDRRDPRRQLPFIGRIPEIDAINHQIALSRRGAFKLVTVSGRPGIGRTALLDHLYHSLPGTVGREQFTPLDREQPGMPLARALSHALGDGVGAADAAQYASAPFVAEDSDALHRLRSVLERHAPMVLLLDDMQWADFGTLTALAWLGRAAPELPVTVVAAVRTTPSLARRPLSILEPHERLDLEALASEATQTAGVDDDLVAATGGVPGLLADAWRWARAGGVGPSPSLREAVLRSVRGLGGVKASILQQMSRLEEPVDPFDVSANAPLSTDSALATLDDLCTMGILARTGTGYRFQAPIVREIIATTVAEAQAAPPARSQPHPVRPRSIVPGRR